MGQRVVERQQRKRQHQDPERRNRRRVARSVEQRNQPRRRRPQRESRRRGEQRHAHRHPHERPPSRARHKCGQRHGQHRRRKQPQRFDQPEYRAVERDRRRARPELDQEHVDPEIQRRKHDAGADRQHVAPEARSVHAARSWPHVASSRRRRGARRRVAIRRLTASVARTGHNIATASTAHVGTPQQGGERRRRSIADRCHSVSDDSTSLARQSAIEVVQELDQSAADVHDRQEQRWPRRVLQ